MITIECSQCRRIIELKGDGAITELRCPDCEPELYIEPDPDVSPYYMTRGYYNLMVINVGPPIDQRLRAQGAATLPGFEEPGSWPGLGGE